VERRFGIALASFLLALIFGAWIWHGLRASGASAQGQRMRPLLKELREGPNVEAEQAIREIGTNALPALLQMAGATNSVVRSTLLGLARRQSALAFDFRDAAEAHELAACGFHALGPIAQGAVPALTNLLGNPDPEVQRAAISCLSSIGPAAAAAVPVLIREFTNTDRIVRATAKFALGSIHSQPAIAIPALVANLSARDGSAHLTASALGKFGSEAKAAIPALLPLLNDPNSSVRYFASNALIQIDREAATQAGVK
jgi:hypothetical protein